MLTPCIFVSKLFIRVFNKLWRNSDTLLCILQSLCGNFENDNHPYKWFNAWSLLLQWRICMYLTIGSSSVYESSLLDFFEHTITSKIVWSLIPTKRFQILTTNVYGKIAYKYNTQRNLVLKGPNYFTIFTCENTIRMCYRRVHVQFAIFSLICGIKSKYITSLMARKCNLDL